MIVIRMINLMLAPSVELFLNGGLLHTASTP